MHVTSIKELINSFTPGEKSSALEDLSSRNSEDFAYLVGKTFLTEAEFVANGGTDAVKFSVASAIEALTAA